MAVDGVGDMELERALSAMDLMNAKVLCQRSS